MNPCPCGHLGDPRYDCRCPPPLVERYRGSVSGPLLDRIDLHVEVPAVTPQELRSSAGETRRGRRPAGGGGARAPARALRRGLATPVNASMGPEALRRHCVARRGRPARSSTRAFEQARPLGPRPRPHPQGRPHHRRPRGQRPHPRRRISPRRSSTAASTGG